MEECEARWRAAGNRTFLADEMMSIITGYVYSVLLDTDRQRRNFLDAVLAGKTIDDEGKVVEKLREVEVGETKIDLSDLPPGWFDSGESFIPEDYM